MGVEAIHKLKIFYFFVDKKTQLRAHGNPAMGFEIIRCYRVHLNLTSVVVSNGFWAHLLP